MRTLTGAPSRALLTFTALVAVILMALSMAGAGIASAHATRIATDPAEGAALTEAPTRVSATFNEDMQEPFAAMTVVGPDGNLWSVGEPQVEGPVLSVDVRPLGPAGTYTVNYRVTSADGHVVTGAWSFEMTTDNTATTGNTAAEGTPADTAPAAPAEQAPPEPAAPAGDALPVWPFVLVAALIVGAGAWWAVRRRS